MFSKSVLFCVICFIGHCLQDEINIPKSFYDELLKARDEYLKLKKQASPQSTQTTPSTQSTSTPKDSKPVALQGLEKLIYEWRKRLNETYAMEPGVQYIKVQLPDFEKLLAQSEKNFTDLLQANEFQLFRDSLTNLRDLFDPLKVIKIGGLSFGDKFKLFNMLFGDRLL